MQTKFCQIQPIRSEDIDRKQNSEIKGRYSVRILRNINSNNTNLTFVNVDVHTKFGQILSIHSQDIVRKQNSDANQGP